MLRIDEAPKIKFDRQKFQNLIRPYLLPIAEEAADTLIRVMQQYVDVTTYGGAPGHKAWRQDVGNALTRLMVDWVGDTIEGEVGLQSAEDYEQVRALQIAYGSGSKSTAPDWHASPIMFGPEGREVWDDDLMNHVDGGSHHIGRPIPAPSTWNQPGNEYVQKAVREVNDNLQKLLQHAIDLIPANAIMGCFSQ